VRHALSLVSSCLVMNRFRARGRLIPSQSQHLPSPFFLLFSEISTHVQQNTIQFGLSERTGIKEDPHIHETALRIEELRARRIYYTVGNANNGESAPHDSEYVGGSSCGRDTAGKTKADDGFQPSAFIVLLA
jgi:hypothetical protein